MSSTSTLTPRRRRCLQIIAGVILLYAIVGFFVAPPILRSQATERLSETLHRPVAIEKISLNPFTFSATIRGFTVTDHDGAELAGFDVFHANFQLSSLFRWMWYFSEVRLERPRGRIVVAADGTLNVADLAPPPATEPAEPAAPPRFMIETLAVSAGSLDFSDNSRASPFNTTVGPVTVSLHNFGTGGGEAGNIALQGSTESGERFAFDGTLQLNDLNIAGLFTMTGLHAPKYDPFHQTTTLFEVAGGKISFDVRFVLNAKGGLTWQVDPADLAIEGLRIRARGETEDAIYLPALLLSGVRADSATRTATVARVALEAFPEGGAPAWTVQGGDPAAAAQGVTMIRLTRLPDGSLDLATLLTPRLEPPAAEEATATAPSAAPWTATIAEVSIKDSRIEFSDISNKEPVRLLIDGLTFIARNISTDPAAEIPFETNLRWQEQGTLRARGTATREPLNARVEFEATDLLLAALDPYLEPFAAVRLVEGAARASGTLTVSQDPSATEPTLTFEGAAGLDGLVVKTADGETPLTSLGSLDLREIRFKSPPVTLDIAEVAVRSPAVSLIIAADGTINLTTVMKTVETPAPAVAGAVAPVPTDAAPAAPRPVITIGRVVIDDGRADVADLSMSKEFTTSLRDFGGTISGLSSEELARADVDLKGTLDGTAPFQVSGKINPLSEDAFTDLRVDFRGIGLAAFTPYSGRYVGYTIDRGRLSMDLTYHLSSRVLEAENKLVFDQFYLGETVESPDAMNLPLKLALGLLRDRSGKIDIDLPIRGNLDDPDFRYGSLVWKAIGNIIAKAATAPFSLLGKLVPGGDPEALSYVEFAPGSEVLDDASAGKVATLANALYERPALGLEIVSRPQPDLDAQPLREQRFHSILVGRHIRGLAAAGQPSVDPATVELDPAARAALIRAEFAEAFPSEVEPADTGPADSPAVQDESGVIKRTYRRILGVFGKSDEAAEEPPPPVVQPEIAATGPTLAEMESRLLARVEIPLEEFQALAEGRAKVIRDHLVATGRVEPERVTIATPGAAAEGPAATAPRVEFALK